MKKHSIYSATKRLLATLLLATATITAIAAQPEEGDRIKALDDLSNEELLQSVKFSGKNAELVKEFQKKEATRLLRTDYKRETGCDVELFRDGEVIILTIPAASLFGPNSTRLTQDADRYLNPLKRYLKAKHPDMYRVLLIMHTDNTGSTSYTDNLSLTRVEAIYDFLDEAGADTRYLFPTAAGATDPMVPNNTVDNRAKNRRLEVYLIPGKKMLEAAKKGSIAL